MLNVVKDALALVFALGHRSVAAVIGHDFGSPVAAFCALARPDVFRSVVMMSAPFAGPPSLPFAGASGPANAATAPLEVLDELATLARPRKHYHWYYSTREANANMQHAAQGIHAFLRAYYHHKSADWRGNQPFKLAAGAPANWRRCRPITSWIWHTAWPRRSRAKCRPRPRSPHAGG